jgi:hypothetical protein
MIKVLRIKKKNNKYGKYSLFKNANIYQNMGSNIKVRKMQWGKIRVSFNQTKDNISHINQ